MIKDVDFLFETKFSNFHFSYFSTDGLQYFSTAGPWKGQEQVLNCQVYFGFISEETSSWVGLAP